MMTLQSNKKTLRIAASLRWLHFTSTPQVAFPRPSPEIAPNTTAMHINSLRSICTLIIALCFTTTTHAQKINPRLLQHPWKAHWICPVKTDQWSASSNPKLQQYGVYKYRKAFTLDQVPESFVVHVSADNRFKLFVNGKQIAGGPARSDLYFWNFETIDLAPHLTPGKNTIAALVWNEGPHRPMAQIPYLPHSFFRETQIPNQFSTLTKRGR